MGNISPQEATVAAREYLRGAPDERSAESQQVLCEPEVVLAVLRLLRELFDSRPAVARGEASSLYDWISRSGRTVGVFDEKDYFLGEAALIAGIGCRLLGRSEESARWLDLAEAAFGRTVHPAPYLANVTYNRLALHYQLRRFDRVFDQIGSVVETFERLGMARELGRCRFLEAMALKESGELEKATEKFELTAASVSADTDPTIFALTMVHLGDINMQAGHFDEAMRWCQSALSAAGSAMSPVVRAQLKVVVGGTMKRKGNLTASVEAYREAIAEYAAIGMRSSVAYLRIINSEVLLALGRNREAEWEILAALPTIDEEKMVPEGLTAMALLKESVSRRKTDPKALQELRDHLKVKA